MRRRFRFFRSPLVSFASAAALLALGCGSAGSDRELPGATGGKADDADENAQALLDAAVTVEELAQALMAFDGGPDVETLLRTDPHYAVGADYYIDEPPLGRFCGQTDPQAGPAPGYNTDNAETLAWMSANQYGHYVPFAADLARAGWATPQDAELWRWRAVALQLARLGEAWRGTAGGQLMEFFDTAEERERFEAIIDDSENFGPQWLDEVAANMIRILEQEEELFGARDSASLEQMWMQQAQAGLGLQFFTAGRVELTTTGPEFRQESTQVAWIRHPTQNVAILVFRGTEPQRGDGDIWTDLNGFKEPVFLNDRSYHIHRGFLGALQSVEPMLVDKFETDGRSDSGEPARLWITGHSLGGALAALTAAGVRFLQTRGDAAAQNVELAGAYTFGAPRVGDLKFAQALSTAAEADGFALLRFRHADDPVSKVAPQEFGTFDFAHAGEMVLLNPAAAPLVQVRGLPIESTIAFASTAEPARWGSNDMTLEHFAPEFVVGDDGQLDKRVLGSAIDVEVSLLGCLDGNIELCAALHAMGPHDEASEFATYYSQLRRQAEQAPVTDCADDRF